MIGDDEIPLRTNVPDLAALPVPNVGMFPRTGLVKQYEGFIRRRVRYFCIQHPQVDHDEALAEAIKIAVEVEKKFDPGRGYDFSTPLRHHLKGLYRILIVNPARYGITLKRRKLDVAEANSGDVDKLQQMMAWAADRVRPLVSGNQHHLAVLDWMLCPNGQALTQIAAKAGISKGYASKIRRNLQRRMQQERANINSA
jgi:hypothetical protein